MDMSNHVIKGGYCYVYDKIKWFLKNSDLTLDDCFKDVVAEDLTITDVIRLYAQLKYELEEAEILRVGKDQVKNLSKDYELSRRYWVENVEAFYG
jgi:hypothetical protein